MILDSIGYGVHWLISSVIGFLPSFDPTTSWVVYLLTPIKDAGAFLNLWIDVSIVFPFMITVGLIVLSFEMYHVIHQWFGLIRGVQVNKDHI